MNFCIKYYKPIKYFLLISFFLYSCNQSNSSYEIREWKVMDLVFESLPNQYDTLYASNQIPGLSEFSLTSEKLDSIIKYSQINTEINIKENISIIIEASKLLNHQNQQLKIVRIVGSRDVGYMVIYYNEKYGVIAKIRNKKAFLLARIVRKNHNSIISIDSLEKLSQTIITDIVLTPPPPKFQK